MKHSTLYQSGLKENLPQFLLLVIINAFVGGMIGLERAVLSNLGTELMLTLSYSVL